MAEFTLPGKIITGEGALVEAGSSIAKLGKKALVITGKHVGRLENMKELQKILEQYQIQYIVFDGITGEPTDTMIEEGVRIYKKNHCDFCIGIGGGSPLDSAKAIAAMSTGTKKISDYNGKAIEQALPPVVAIPTTAGTGSEATKFTIITDTEKNIKMLLKGDVLLPSLAIVDSHFSISTPQSVTAATGLDALTHAVEAYTSKKAQPLTDVYAVSAVRRILHWLPKAYRDGEDRTARSEMAQAALEAGICINNSSVTIVHGMSRPIGALFHVPHGISNAMLLCTCLKNVADGAMERFARLSRESGIADEHDRDEEAVKMLFQKLDEICRICNVPTLQEYGIKKRAYMESIDKMTDDAIASGSPGNCIKSVSAKDIRRIYKEVWNDKNE
ncbi:MAG TPA: iron-containing alcohol dehydrogenase [Candidatus Fimousia stercorigallinarum]|nr:iron-containing alcohol dehydrogenase [Candidatus Fimousia stercorigallinarum]